MFGKIPYPIEIFGLEKENGSMLQQTATLTHQIGIFVVLTHVGYLFLTYQRIRDREISMQARCRKNLSHIATHVR